MSAIRCDVCGAVSAWIGGKTSIACAGCYDKMLERAETAEAEIARLHSWAGLMELLDAHYPVDVVQDWGGDEGPRVCALVREIDKLRTVLATAFDVISSHEGGNELVDSLAIVVGFDEAWGR